MVGFRVLLVLVGLTWANRASSAEPAFDSKALAATLRPMLVSALPSPLAVAPMSWGEQREVVIGVKWEKQRLLYKPEPMKANRNDGHWQKVTLTALDPAKSLALEIQDVRQTGETTIFRARVALDVRAVYEQQLWKIGTRVYAGETHVRCRGTLELTCELTARTTLLPGARLPTLDLKLKATEANVGYSDFVCEHTLGLNGRAAEVLGKTAFEVVKKVAPKVEKDLLAKADAAVLKAAASKEVRVEFDKWLRAGK